MNTQYLTVEELSEWIRISKSKIYTLVSQNKIPFTKLGGKVLFEKQQIQSWIDQQSSSK